MGDANRVLTQLEVPENKAVMAVRYLNEMYPDERWVGAESWRAGLPFRVAFMGAIFPSVRYQYRRIFGFSAN